ncbi:MAG: DUF6616 family protein [Bacteroidota bacterium]
MIYFVEIWNAKPALLALSVEERGAYMANIGPHIQDLLAKGVEVLTWSDNATVTTKRAAYDYFAIWKFPDQATADGFQQLVDNVGWYNYFEQTNLMGEAASAQEIIGQLINL